jgi:hypothetical protein
MTPPGNVAQQEYGNPGKSGVAAGYEMGCEQILHSYVILIESKLTVYTYLKPKYNVI